MKAKDINSEKRAIARLFLVELKSSIFATTALVLSAGVAAADVAVSGDGRMGIVNNGTTTAFNSRIRIAFTASGETDGGLSFGGMVRANDAVNGAAGTAGSVFISGDFGRITMGDIAGAAEGAVGNIAQIGYTELRTGATYLSNGAAARPAMRYDYTIGDVSLHLSSNQQTAGTDIYALGARYSANGVVVGLGHEVNGAASHTIIGGSYTVSGIGLAANYGRTSAGLTQTSASVSYTMDALTIAGIYTDNRITPSNTYGLGVSYNLGGGATLRAGWVNRVRGTSTTDLGLNFAF